MAKKPLLSKKQQRQVSANRRKRLREQADPAATQTDNLLSGTVTGRFGKHADVEEKEGRTYRCHIRRTIDSVVCGDKVQFSPDHASDNALAGIIETVLDRQSVLTRPDYYDGVKPVAANINQIIVVSAVLPSLSLNIIDRYLVAAEDVGISPVILLNKVELLDQAQRRQVERELKIYQNIGYRVLFTSCKNGEGLDTLAALLQDHVSVFVGQSGVGKSSLVNRLLPGAKEAIGEISENSGLGQHTTTAAKLLHFPSGGDLIDSPGVREFALWHLPMDRISSGFIEFRDYLGGCKFRDCSHADDPGCLIKQAVIEGKISQQRFDSYHKILTTMEQQRPNRSRP